MKVIHSSSAKTLSINSNYQDCLLSVSRNELINIVEEISIPRHFKYNAKNNQTVAEYIFSQLSDFGYETHVQGQYSNVVAFNPNIRTDKLILVGAHYDSVPNCPGADDNGSAVASLLACAKAISEFD